MVDIEELDIKEHFLKEDGEALTILAKRVAIEGCVFIEVGSFKGFSASFLGQVAKKCHGDVFCVDYWKEHLDVFRRNMRELGLDMHVHPLVMESVTASKIFGDGAADLVFIDADHRYASIKRDLEAWWPKVKVGGILCGHDCEAYYSTYEDPHSIDNSLEADYCNGIHPGVIKALHEFFNDTHERIEGTIIWYKVA